MEVSSRRYPRKPFSSAVVLKCMHKLADRSHQFFAETAKYPRLDGLGTLFVAGRLRQPCVIFRDLVRSLSAAGLRIRHIPLFHGGPVV